MTVEMENMVTMLKRSNHAELCAVMEKSGACNGFYCGDCSLNRQSNLKKLIEELKDI